MEEQIEGTKEVSKPRVLWVSDLVSPTGFARVAHSIIKYLKDSYDITGVGINYRGDPHSYDIPIFPASLGGNIFGENRVVDMLNSGRFDMLFILNDPWVINRLLSAIKKEVKVELPKIVIYFPVDSTSHDPDWYANFDIVTKAVTYTRFGEWVVKDCNPNVKLDIIPHGVDSDTFFRKYATKEEAKSELFGKFVGNLGNLSDSFIVLNANRNQPRKKLDITMKGFAMFAKDKPKEVKLYMHCGIVDAHIDVSKLSVRYGISDRLIVTSNKVGIQTVSEERLNEIYNACDVGINTSLGEGWGLTNVEHAVTGAAQVVPNHSSCREIFTGCGVLVPAKIDITFDNSMTVGKMVTAEDVAEALEMLYQDKTLREDIAKAAYSKFLAKEYSWEEIAKRWDKVFSEALSETKDVSTTKISE